MALETGTYISDLVTTNPTAGDPVSQADDHIRLLKTVLQNSVPYADTPVYPVVNGTATASTSGTSIDFTGIPSWAKRITINLSAVSVSGTSVPQIQLGDSGGVETSNYNGSTTIVNDTDTFAASHSAGFLLATVNTADNSFHGVVTLTLLNASTNLWACSINVGFSNTAATAFGGGSKLLSGALDRIRLTTAGGVNTFDAGSVNIQYD